MVIWNTRVLQDGFNYIRIKEMEDPKPSEEEDEESTWTSITEKKSDINPDPELGEIELQNLEEDVIIPYTTSTALLLLGLFAISFIVIMTIRGVLSDLPNLFKFFSNIYLAGTVICG